MDLTTLTYLVLFGLGLVAVDAVLHHNSIIVDVATAPKTAEIEVDQETLTAGFEHDLYDIVRSARIVSVAAPHVQLSKHEGGVGMALARATNLQQVAYALQDVFQVSPDRIRFALFIENGELRGFVDGESRRWGDFQRIFTPKKGEKLMHFVRRCAVWGGSRVAPYATGLYLLPTRAEEGSLDDVAAIAALSKAAAPTDNSDRALFDNLRGLVALFRNDPQAAQAAFHEAAAEGPAMPVALLNAAFTDLLLGGSKEAAAHMAKLVHVTPPVDHFLLMTAYMTWGAALMAQKDLPQADRVLEKAVAAYPRSAAALGLWAEEKRLAGDDAAAAALDRKAQSVAESFQNYAELAALWFQLPWRDATPVRSKYPNPDYHAYQ